MQTRVFASLTTPAESSQLVSMRPFGQLGVGSLPAWMVVQSTPPIISANLWRCCRRLGRTMSAAHGLREGMDASVERLRQHSNPPSRLEVHVHIIPATQD